MKNTQTRILSRAGHIDSPSPFSNKITYGNGLFQFDSNNQPNEYGLGIQIVKLKTEPKQKTVIPRAPLPRPQIQRISVPRKEPRINNENKLPEKSIKLPRIVKTPQSLEKKTKKIPTTELIENEPKPKRSPFKLNSRTKPENRPSIKPKEPAENNTEPETKPVIEEEPPEPRLTIVQSRLRPNSNLSFNTLGNYNPKLIKNSLSEMTSENSTSLVKMKKSSSKDILRTKSDIVPNSKFSHIEKKSVSSITPKGYHKEARHTVKQELDSKSNLNTSTNDVSRIEEYRFKKDWDQDGDEELEDYLKNKNTEPEFEFDYTKEVQEQKDDLEDAYF